MVILIIGIISYLMGSIPFGLILTKIFLKKDIRNIGSGNIGATNVLRTGNKTIGYITLSLDILKAVTPVIFVKIYHTDFLYLASLCAFLGHVFPVWLKFKGGKGVATFLGTYLGYLVFVPSESYSTNFKILIFVSLLATFVLIAKVFRVSAIASLITVIISSYFIISEKSDLFVNMMTVLIVVIIIFQHRTNIRRLIEGRENKF